MSASESVRASLGLMGLSQLVLLFVALFAYGLALSQAFPARVRGATSMAALVAAAGFSAATPQWADGVVLLALTIALLGVFAAAAWLLAVLLRLDAPGGGSVVDAGPGHEKAARHGPEAPLQPGHAAALP